MSNVSFLDVAVNIIKSNQEMICEIKHEVNNFNKRMDGYMDNLNKSMSFIKDELKKITEDKR